MPACLKAAIVGSGPSGFYAAEALLAGRGDVEVDLIERLPVPFGLVRFGVAPDHPRLKDVCSVFEGIARDGRLRLMANVDAGGDVGFDELRALYDVVVIATGAACDRRLGIPGEDLPGSHSATEFVGWYNGHPDFCDRVFDLGQETAAVIGHGNVAVDVCRILAKDLDELRSTDMCAHAVEALAGSRVREIHLIGRRGPVQAKFTAKELRELGELRAADAVVPASSLELAAACQAELAGPKGAASAKNLAILRQMAGRGRKAGRAIHIRFLQSPAEIFGAGRVEGLRIQHNRLSGEPHRQVAEPTGHTEVLHAGLVFRSVGYKGTAIAGLPFDARSGTIPNAHGRVLDRGTAAPGLYVTGWIKRGPTGIIGTNRADSIETVEHALADFAGAPPARKPGRDGMARLLADRGVAVVDLAHWSRIDALERRRGESGGKPREKLTAIGDMLALREAVARPLDRSDARCRVNADPPMPVA